jgi:hypothetical protein
MLSDLVYNDMIYKRPLNYSIHYSAYSHLSGECRYFLPTHKVHTLEVFLKFHKLIFYSIGILFCNLYFFLHKILIVLVLRLYSDKFLNNISRFLRDLFVLFDKAKQRIFYYIWGILIQLYSSFFVNNHGSNTLPYENHYILLGMVELQKPCHIQSKLLLSEGYLVILFSLLMNTIC